MGHKGFIYLNLGALNRRVGDINTAFECYRKSAILSPGDGGVYYNLGNLERGRLNCTAATRWFRRAIAVQPNDGTFHWNLALVLLLDDQLSAGFAEYEWRWQHSGFPTRRRTFQQPEWDGAPFDGKTLLIHAEQGMGDHFQFLRFIGDIAKRKGETGKIILECHGPLMPLLADFPEADQVIKREVETNDHLPQFDIHMPIVSAPHRLGVRSWDDMPKQHPYLHVPAGADVELPGLRPEALKIGFVWGGNPDFSDDKARSTQIDFFQPLFDLPGTQFFCLQKGPREAEIAAAPAHVVRANELIETFRDTAAIMQKMDIVVTTCTSVAHLAGGLGPADLGVVALHLRLALAPAPRRQPVVPVGPPVSPTQPRRLGVGVRGLWLRPWRRRRRPTRKADQTPGTGGFFSALRNHRPMLVSRSGEGSHWGRR